MPPAWPRRRFQRRPRLGVWIVVLVILAVASYFGRDEIAGPPASVGQGVIRDVHRVVDGDTLLMEGGERLRLIGVDTPETKKENTPVEPWGPEATAFTEDFIDDGPVRLTYDDERKDQYGRTLAYVWVEEKLLNEALIRAGLARATLQYRFSGEMKHRFRQAQEAAKRERLGIWSGKTGVVGDSANPPISGDRRAESPF